MPTRNAPTSVELLTPTPGTEDPDIYAFARSEVSEVQDVISTMTATLIRRKLLYPERLLDRYYLVAVDGTGFLTYAERHCPQCLTRTHRGHTTYYHPVLEAKLITPSGWPSPSVNAISGSTWSSSKTPTFPTSTRSSPCSTIESLASRCGLRWGV